MPSAPTASKLSRAQIADAMRKAGWPESAIPIGVAVAMAESGGNPRAVNRANSNGSSDHGLFQINSIHGSLLKTGDPYNPVDNARMALKVYKDAGNSWRPWSVFKSGSYRKFYTGRTEGNPSTASVGVDDGGFWGGFGNSTGTVVEGAATGVAQASIVGTLGYLADPSFWRRLGIGLLAVGLIIVGIVIVFRQPIGSGVKAGVNLIPAGKVANVVKGVVK